jgi:hypothetical protein
MHFLKNFFHWLESDTRRPAEEQRIYLHPATQIRPIL